jgi:ABC-2 type transport system permease protein
MSWQRVRAIARRQAYVLQRSPHRFYDITIWPLVDTLLFGSIGVYAGREGGVGAGAAFLLSGILLWHVVYQAQIALATGFLEETWSRGLLGLMVTPLREVEYVAGVALFGLVKLWLGVGAVALAAVGFYAFDITSLGFAFVPIAGVLLLVGWAVALLVMGMVLRFGTGAEALAWGILFVVMPLSGVFYPVDALPVVLRPISLALPTTHAFAVGREVVAGDGIDWAQLGLAWLAALVLVALALWFVTAMLRLFRQRGYITRYS